MTLCSSPCTRCSAARTLSWCLVQLDDALREILPVNAPGAPDYPSWRRRYSRTVDAFGDEPLLAAVAEVLGARHRAAVNSVS